MKNARPVYMLCTAAWLGRPNKQSGLNWWRGRDIWDVGLRKGNGAGKVVGFGARLVVGTWVGRYGRLGRVASDP